MRLNWIHFLLIIPVFSLSCDEALPPRQDPTSLFKVSLQSFYVYTDTENDVAIVLSAINDFDETLNDRLALSGTIVITSDRDSSVHKTIPLSTANLIGGHYDPVKGILTIDPGDSVVVQAKWDLTDDNGVSLPSYFFQYHVDAMCRDRLISSPEYFTISGKAKLYANLGYAESQLTYAIRQYDKWIAPKYCIPL
jgi:hypothetical protein